MRNNTIYDYIDMMQELIDKNHSNVLSHLITQDYINKSMTIADLGCGTGLYSRNIVDHLKANFRINYQGIDLDPEAISRINNRFKEFPSDVYTITKQSVFDFDYSCSNILICLSNTFLSLGNKNELIQFLQSLSHLSNIKKLIISVCPWDEKRIAYNLYFKDWSSLPIHKGVQFKVHCPEVGDSVEQEILFKTNDENSLRRSDFKFLKLNVSEINELFKSSGWNNVKWHESWETGKDTDPNESDSPEFLLHIER